MVARQSTWRSLQGSKPLEGFACIQNSLRSPFALWVHLPVSHCKSRICDPNGIRTRVTAVKGRCPRPLDDRVSERQISRRRQGLQAAFVAVNPITHSTSAWLVRSELFDEYCRSGSRFSMRLNHAKGVVCQLFSLRGATQ